MFKFARTNVGELFCKWKAHLNMKVNSKYKQTKALYDTHI